MTPHAKRLGLYLVFGALICASYPAWAGHKKQIEAHQLRRIEVVLNSGSVQLIAWNGNHVTVEREKTALPIDVRQGILRVGAIPSQKPKMSDRVKILAPQHLLLSVVVDSATVDVQGFSSSRIQVVTMGGHVRVSSCSAPLEIETVSGDIHAQHIKGDISLKTVSGTIRAENIKASFMETKSVNGSQYVEQMATRQLRMRSHSGEITFEGTVPDNGFWESATFDGDMHFEVNEGAPLDLEVQSRMGQVEVDEAVTAREKAGNYFRGRLGTAKTLVRLTSFEGAITVRIDD
ncbi:MAG: DUF4097 family beta strand repeat-containing protein [Myxococcota bacterium]|nr:DUF4097 family beta strand repeat-containing protein [Myxococcota bacterium]